MAGLSQLFTVGTVTTGEVGSEAKVTISGSKENPVLNFVLHAGGFNLDKVYPVGSVCLSMSKTNPGTIFLVVLGCRLQKVEQLLV